MNYVAYNIKDGTFYGARADVSMYYEYAFTFDLWLDAVNAVLCDPAVNGDHYIIVTTQEAQRWRANDIYP